MSQQSDLDNHANQLNPNNDAYYQSRGLDGRARQRLGRRRGRVCAGGMMVQAHLVQESRDGLPRPEHEEQPHHVDGDDEDGAGLR